MRLLFTLFFFVASALSAQETRRTLIRPSATAETQTLETAVPPGTRVMMRLVSALNTESGTKGSGAYLQTVFPVVHNGKVVIPAGTYVTGVVTANKQAGRFRRKASFQIAFTKLLFANGTEVPIAGVLQSLPGTTNTRVDEEGKVKRTDQLDKELPKIGFGALIGGLAGSVSSTGIGNWKSGAGYGAALATGAVLLSRGDALHLPAGTNVEMALTAPVTIPAEASQAAATVEMPVQDGNSKPLEAEAGGRQHDRRRLEQQLLALELMRLMVR